MKQFYLLTKTLLVVVCLLVGGASSALGENMTTMTGMLGLTDNSTPAWTYYSKTATLKAGETYTYTFQNYTKGSSATAEYETWIAEIRENTTNYCLDARGDGGGWKWEPSTDNLVYNYLGKAWNDNGRSLSDFMTAYNGVTVTLTISSSADGKTVTIARSATLIDGTTDYSGTWTCSNFAGNDKTINLIAEASHQDITKVVHTSASGVSTMYKTVDLSLFDANSTYSDGTASFQLSGSKWSKLDLSSYYSDISGIITNVKLNFTENIGTGGRMCFGIFGNNKNTWNNGMPETANSVSTWGICGDSYYRVYYSSKPSNVNTLTVGSSQAIEIDMDMINKSFSFVQGNTTLVDNQPFIDTYITSPKYFAGHTWTNESNTTTLSNMTIEIVYRNASYFVDECKTYETSAAFATYIDGLNSAGSLKTVEDIYAAYTSWQIAQAEENGSVDYTKVLYNADYSLGTKSGWTISGDANTGADSDGNKFGMIESNGNGGYQYNTGWNGRNVSQTITGLPAGKYRLTARVYSWQGGAPVRLFANGVLSDQENGDDHTPSLDFTVTGEESSIKIGIGGVGGATENDNTDKTWGAWGYRIDYFTLTKIASSATIGATGWTTFASAYPLDLSSMTASDASEVTAYYASAIGDDKVTMTATESTGVAAGEGLMLKGNPGATITIPVAASGEAIIGNKLVGCTVSTTLEKNATSGYNNYVLVNNGGTAEFQSLAEIGATIPAGKAYLQNGTYTSDARLNIVFEDEGVTAIKAINASNISGAQADGKYLENGKIVIVKNGTKFNANGQKVK